MIGWIISNAAPYVIALGALLAALLGYGARQKAKGRRQAADAALRDSIKRQEDGRNAVANLHGAGRADLAQQLRDNDGRWK